MMGLLKNKGWSNSTGEESSTNTFTILPEISDSISLNNFIASITQTVVTRIIRSPTSTKMVCLEKVFCKKYQ